MNEYNREKHLEVVLKQLIGSHFFSKGLEWGWQEGINLRSKDPELWIQLVELIPEVINNK